MSETTVPLVFYKIAPLLMPMVDREAAVMPAESEPWHVKVQRWLRSAKAKTNKQKLRAESSTQKQWWKYFVLDRNRSRP